MQSARSGFDMLPSVKRCIQDVPRHEMYSNMDMAYDFLIYFCTNLYALGLTEYISGSVVTRGIHPPESHARALMRSVCEHIWGSGGRHLHPSAPGQVLDITPRLVVNTTYRRRTRARTSVVHASRHLTQTCVQSSHVMSSRTSPSMAPTTLEALR